jgi:hypothetical protein
MRVDALLIGGYELIDLGMTSFIALLRLDRSREVIARRCWGNVRP